MALINKSNKDQITKKSKKLLFKKQKQDNTYLKACSWIYSNLKPYLQSSISINGIKNLFLLSIFDYLCQEINFDEFLYIANELFTGIGPGFDLQMKDPRFFHLLLDLDEIENSNQALEKEWRTELVNYYQFCLPNQFWVRENEIQNTLKEVVKLNQKVLTDYFEKETKRWQNNKISLAELVYKANRIKKITQFPRNQFLNTIERIVDLIPKWFLEKDNHLIIKEIKKLSIS